MKRLCDTGQVLREPLIREYCLNEADFMGVRHVLDLGAHDGSVSMLAAMILHGANVHAVEPALDAYVACEANSEGLYTAHHMGIAPVEGQKVECTLGIGRRPGVRAYTPTDKGTIESHTLAWMTKEFKLDPRSGLLKADCEGAEHCLLDDPQLSQWMIVACELHPASEKEREELCLKALRIFGRSHTVTLFWSQALHLQAIRR